MISANIYQASRFPTFRQTFGCNGKCRSIQFFTDNLDADWQVVGSPMPDLGSLARKKILYIQNETPDFYLPTRNQLKRCSAILTPISFKNIEAIPQIVAPTCLPWLYGVRVEMRADVGHYLHPTGFLSLEDLIENQPTPKTRILSMIVSGKTFLPGHKLRMDFVGKVANHFGDKIDIYGFDCRPILDKRQAIDPYMFSIAIENSVYVNYVTEKLSDVYLGHTMPIYHGAPNASELFPAESMLKIDIADVETSIAQIDGLISHPEKFNLAAVTEARRRVLMEYNCFDLVAQAIEEVESRNKGQETSAMRRRGWF